MRSVLKLVAIGVAVSGAACIDLEYGIALDEDLSGTSTLDMRVDLERIAVMKARMERMFAGKEGPPSEEEIAAARADLLADVESEEFDEDELKREIRPDLPPGVELLTAEYARDGLEMRVEMKFRFDDVASLNDFHLRMPAEGGAESAGKDGSRPFEGLEVIDEGGTLVVRNEPLNPVDVTRDGTPWIGEEMLADMLEGLRVAFRIEAPFEVVEHNATRIDGRALYWEYDLSSLESDPGGIFVRYRK